MVPRQYRKQVDALVADLGLNPDSITWNFVNRRAVRRKGKRETYGECRATKVSATISVAYKQPEAHVLNTIAHELRHYWHKVQGVYSYDGALDERTWRGTHFAPRPEKWKGDRNVNERPDERDCRAYARESVKRLFGIDSFEPESTTERVQEMLLRARARGR